MFCPRCAEQNPDTAGFCRVCGANIKLVPQALTGELPQVSDDSDCAVFGRKRGAAPTLDRAFKSIFMGIAFLLISFALAFTIGRVWWFWMLIPAFSFIGTGIAQYIRVREADKKRMLTSTTTQSSSISAGPPANLFPARNTGELPSPPSVTEGTTRHLSAEAQTRHLDAGK